MNFEKIFNKPKLFVNSNGMILLFNILFLTLKTLVKIKGSKLFTESGGLF